MTETIHSTNQPPSFFDKGISCDLTSLNEICKRHVQQTQSKVFAILTNPDGCWNAFCMVAAKQGIDGFSLDSQGKWVHLSIKEPEHMRKVVDAIRNKLIISWRKNPAQESSFVISKDRQQEEGVPHEGYPDSIASWLGGSTPLLPKKDVQEIFLPAMHSLCEMLGATLTTRADGSTTRLNIQPPSFVETPFPISKKYSSLSNGPSPDSYLKNGMAQPDRLAEAEGIRPWEKNQGPHLLLKAKGGETIAAPTSLFEKAEKISQMIQKREDSAYSRGALEALLDFLESGIVSSRRLESKEGIEKIDLFFELFELADSGKLLDLTCYCLNLLKRYASFDEANKIKEKADQYKDPYLRALYKDLLAKELRKISWDLP